MNETEAVVSVSETSGELPTLDRLLNVASTLFWKKGYAATSTREIAAQAGIRQASLYHHVANKEELLHKICVAAMDRFLEHVERETAGIADPLERIRHLVPAHIAALLEHQALNVTMLTELRSITREHRSQVIEMRQRYARSVLAMFEEAQALHQIRQDIPAKYLIFEMFDLLNWTSLWFREGRDKDPAQLAGILSKIFFEGARRPGSGPRAPFIPRAGHQKRTGKPLDPGLARLVGAAVKLFSRKGYEAATTREVATLLGIQKASLYYHIQGKEDLLYAICKSSSESILAEVQAALEDVEIEQRLPALIHAHITSMLRDRMQHSITFGDLKSLADERRAEITGLRRKYEVFVEGLVEEGQASGVLRTDIDPRYLHLGLLGMMNRALRWYRPGGDLSPAQLSEVLAAVFLEGVLPSGRTVT